MGAFTKQLSNFLWGTIGNAMDGRSVWEHMKELEQKEARGLDRAMHIYERLGVLTGKQEYFDKAAKLAERQTHLTFANTKEAREAYKEYAKALREGNLNKARAPVISNTYNTYNLNFNNSIVNVAERIRASTQEVRNIQEKLQNLKDMGKVQAKDGFEAFKEKYMQDKMKEQSQVSGLSMGKSMDMGKDMGKDMGGGLGR